MAGKNAEGGTDARDRTTDLSPGSVGRSRPIRRATDADLACGRRLRERSAKRRAQEQQRLLTARLRDGTARRMGKDRGHGRTANL